MIENSSVTINDVSKHYDELDYFYRKLWGTHLHHGLWNDPYDSKEVAVKNLTREVLSYLHPLSGKHLIDIGCGYGESARLAIGLGAKKVSGITLSPKQLNFAKAKSNQMSVSYQLGDWCQNEYKSNQFDGAYSIECFSHIIDKQKFLQEVKRTLRPGRRFVMTAWLSSKSPSFWKKQLFLNPICREGRLPSLYNEEEVINLVDSTGLKLFDFVDLSERVWKTWLLSSRGMMNSIRQGEGLTYLLNKNHGERKFALSVLRILAAYKTGAFRYGLFVLDNDSHDKI